MRILGACIFSKFFGGKIKNFLNGTHLEQVNFFKKKKKRRMRI